MVAVRIVTVNLLVAHAAMQPQHSPCLSRLVRVDVDHLAWKIESQCVGRQTGHPDSIMHHKVALHMIISGNVIALATAQYDRNDRKSCTKSE